MDIERSFKSLTALALTALALGLAQAQGDGGVAAAATDSSVLLRWSLPARAFPEGGFLVTRSGGGAPLRVEVPSPMPRDEALAEGLVSGDEYDFLVAMFGPTGSAVGDGDAALARAIATLITVARPDYARVTGTLFEDPTAQAGTEYRYRVETKEGVAVGEVEVTAGRVRDLPRVGGLRARLEEGSVALRWRLPAEEELIASYNIYRSDGATELRLNEWPIFVPLAEGEDPAMFRDGDVVVGRTYSYRVEGVDLFGRAAPRSTPVAIAVPDPARVAPPQIENSLAGDRQITLEWSAPRDERVRAVGVRRYTDVEGEPLLLTPDYLPADAVSFTDDGVEGGVNYYYALVAVDAAGRISAESSLWAERGHNPTPPSAPAEVALREGPDGLTLHWQAPPEADLASYRIYLSREPGADPEEFRFVDATVETDYHLPVAQGSLAELRLVVSAVNSSDVEGPRSRVVSGRLVDSAPPPAPRISDVGVAEGELTVRWAATSNPDVAALRLYRAAADGPFVLIREGLRPDAGHYLDSDVEAGVAYRYALEAVDAVGNSSQRSEPVEARAFDLSRPGPVSGLSVEAAEEGVHLAWRAEGDLRYVVERARSGDGRFTEISDPLQGSGFTDRGGLEGDSYRVFAVGQSGRAGEPSEVVRAR